jgi:dihydroorotate dehydrogenase (NAD+) catalytic subunit
MSGPDLTVRIGSMVMRNPVMVASGIFGYGDEFRGLADYGALGALTLKTVTLRPRAGNPPASRTAETPGGMVNAIGLENVGLEAFVREKLPAALAYGTKDGTEVAAVEANISCPNVKKGGMAFGVDAEASREVVAAVREATGKPIIAKLTPNVTDIGEVALACEEAGADAVSLTNTFAAMVIDVERRRPLLAAGTGGLSGPAIRPAAVYRVGQVARAVGVPVVGMGGIWNGADALEFMVAGASAVAVGTALYADPAAGNRVLAGIGEYLARHGMASVGELVGSLRWEEA